MATTGDETVATAGDEMAATGGVMYANEGPYTFDVRHVEEMVGRLEKRRMATEFGGDETGDETGGPRDETGDTTVAMAGDERDGGDQWGNVYGGELEFDEDEMAALEGQRLVAEFKCGIY